MEVFPPLIRYMGENKMTEVNTMRRILLLALALLCVTFPSLAEDVYTITDPTPGGDYATDRSYLRVKADLDGEESVTLTIRDAWGYLLYQRDYGLCGGDFRSEAVYLPDDGVASTYAVTLCVDGESCAFTVARQQTRLTDSGVYAWGIPLAEVNARRSNKAAVILDVYALEGSSLTVPLMASGQPVGYAEFEVAGGEVTAHAYLTVDGEIVKSAVYVARDAVTAMTLGTNHFTGKKTRLDRAVDLGGTPYAAVMVQVTIDYDPATVGAMAEDAWFLQEQRGLWQEMQQHTANEAVG